jgi:ATP-dependent RNA helicase DeaD
MLGFICNNANISGKSIGKIDLKGVYTFFEVENSVAEQVQQGFKSVDFQGRNVRIEIAGDRDGGSRGGNRERSSGSRERSGGSRERTGGFRDFSGRRGDDRGGSSKREGGDRRRRS